MRRCRISCSNRFRSHTTASFFKHSMALLMENTYPQHWKLSKMILLPKEPSAIISVNQTRPISLLPCLGKVYERCFLVYLRRWMKDNCYSSSRNNRVFASTTQRQTRFVQFLQHISTGLLQQTASLVIYVDFTKAFDQLWAWWFTLQTAPNELSTRTSDLHYRVPEEPQVLHRNEPSHVGHLRGRERSASRILPYTDSISSLPLVIHASPWWHRTEFAPQIERMGQQTWNQVQAYDVEWKQLINFPKTEAAMDTSTSSHSNTLSLDRSTSDKENSRVQIPWLSRWWTSLIQWTLQEDAPKSPKELCYPQIRHSIANVINESEKPPLSSLHSSFSANDIRGLD